MFARTERLTLRPPWPEDAAALAGTIEAHEAATLPWPLQANTAAAWCAQARGPHEPRFVIEALDGAASRLIGGIAVLSRDGDAYLVCWVRPAERARGYATEAARAVVQIARYALPVDRLHALCRSDDRAAGRVLAKLGFREAACAVAGADATADAQMVLDLPAQPDRTLPIAA